LLQWKLKKDELAEFEDDGMRTADVDELTACEEVNHAELDGEVPDTRLEEGDSKAAELDVEDTLDANTDTDAELDADGSLELTEAEELAEEMNEADDVAVEDTEDEHVPGADIRYL
jgi:hypothetical protein